MQLTDFTSADAIRAIIGISVDEVSDTTLALPIYLQNLVLSLEDIYVDLPSVYMSYSALATKTVLEQKLIDIVQVFSAHQSGKFLFAGSLFFPKTITDGRASVTRFDISESLRDDIDKALVAIRRRLKLLLITLGLLPAEVSTNRNYFGVAGLAVDPITNLR